MSFDDVMKRLGALRELFGTMVHWRIGQDPGTIYVVVSVANDFGSYAIPLEDQHYRNLSLASLEERLYQLTGKGKAYKGP